MAITDKKQLLEINDLVIEEVYVPQWNDTVHVRSISATAMDAFQLSIMSEKEDGSDRNQKMSNFRARLVCITLCDAEGNLILDERDARRIGQMSTGAIDIISGVARRLNGISAKDEQEMVGIKADTVKNSENAQSEDFSTD